jgi:hypothetical protein
MLRSIWARGLAAGAAVVLVATAAGCKGSAPPASNAPAEVVCAAGEAACLSAQAKANEEALERQILALHQMQTNAAEASAAAVNAAAGNVVAGPGGAPGAPPPALADGEYDCSDGLHALGKVDIKGPTFRYRPLGAFSGSFAPYQVDAAGAIQWGAPFAGLNDTPPEMITQSSVEPWGFTAMFLASPGALTQTTMICKAPGAKAAHPRSSRPLPSGSVR